MATPPTFFVDYKKGEVNEIKVLLRNPATEKDPNKKREILKKVVALMTMGVDLSELFADIVLCSRTKVLHILLCLSSYVHTHTHPHTHSLSFVRSFCGCRPRMVACLFDLLVADNAAIGHRTLCKRN
jgi:hypothetical protein